MNINGRKELLSLIPRLKRSSAQAAFSAQSFERFRAAVVRALRVAEAKAKITACRVQNGNTACQPELAYTYEWSWANISISRGFDRNKEFSLANTFQTSISQITDL